MQIKIAKLIMYVPFAASCFTKGVSCMFEAMAGALKAGWTVEGRSE